MKDWERMFNDLHDRGYSLGYIKVNVPPGRAAWIVDASRGGHRWTVSAERIEDAVAGLREEVERDFLKTEI